MRGQAGTGALPGDDEAQAVLGEAGAGDVLGSLLRRPLTARSLFRAQLQCGLLRAEALAMPRQTRPHCSPFATTRGSASRLLSRPPGGPSLA